MIAGVQVSDTLSIVHGPPLAQEQGIGALTIPGYLREVCERFAGNEAVAFHGPGHLGGGAVHWTYAELWDQALGVARALVAGGVGRDSRIGVLMTNRPEFLAAVFGASLAGAVFVPLNTFSTPAELEYLLNSSGVSTLLFERSVAGKDFAEMLAGLEPGIAGAAPGRLLSARLPQLRRLVMLGAGAGSGESEGAIEGWDAFIAGGTAVPSGVIGAIADAAKPSDIAAIFFSSGTTSTPKGIIHNHRAIALQWWRWPWMYTDRKPDVRVWTSNAFFWSGPFSLVLGSALSQGGAIVLQSTFDPEEAIALFQSERVSVPVARAHQWARIEASPLYAGADFNALRCFDARTFLETINPTIDQSWCNPRAFGATETLTNIATFPPNTPADVMGASFGPPLPGNIFRIVDPASGETVPAGEYGELAVKGPTLMVGYLGKTADESFDEDGFYHTGDNARIDPEGNLIWDGRLTDMIKTGGANVAPSEVDLAIAAYPGIRLSQTVGVPDRLMSEIVVSCVVAQPGAEVTEGGLRAFLKERLASYKVPRRILMFSDEDVPLTASGAKIKANEMKQRAIARIAAEGTEGAG